LQPVACEVKLTRRKFA